MLQRGWAAYLRSLQKRPLTTKATAASFIFFSSDAATQYASHVSGAASARPDRVVVHSPALAAPTDENDAAQKLLDSREGSDDDHTYFGDAFQAHRSISAATFGVVAATWLHYWWNALEGLVAARLPLPAGASRRSRLANTLVKVLIDQSLAAPLYTYAYYVVTNFLGSAYAAPRSDQPSSDTREMKDILAETHDKARAMLWPTMVQHYKLWPAVHFVNFYAVPLQHRVLVQNTVLVFWSAYLSHLNHQHGKDGLHLMTPNEEIDQAYLRRESRKL
jgi:Mpv17 / PMP22 family